MAAGERGRPAADPDLTRPTRCSSSGDSSQAPGSAGAAYRLAGVTVQEQAVRARAAALTLGRATRATKDAALHAMADALAKAETAVLEANAADVARAEASGTSAALIDRLRLTPDRIAGMADGLRDLAALPDPVGDVVRGWTNANGVQVRQVRVPFGVVGHHLRGAAERDRRCRRHLPEVGQRRAAARLVLGGRLQRCGRRGAAGRAGRRRAAGRRHPAGARTPRGDRGADGRPRPGRRADPARRRRTDRRGRPQQPGAGDRDRRRQLPPLRRRERRPAAWRWRSCSTPRPSGPRSATRWRPCWCTPTSRIPLCRRLCRPWRGRA